MFPRVGDVAVGLEKRADVKGLSTPEMAVDSPIKRQLEGLAVKGSDEGKSAHGLRLLSGDGQ